MYLFLTADKRRVFKGD